MSHVDDGQLNALLDGELSPDETRSVEAHVASCAECARRLNEARAFLAEAGELLAVMTPPGVRSDPVVSATPVEPPLVAPVAPGPAPAHPMTPAERASGPRLPRTLKEVAISVDGRTEKSPAIRPVMPHEVPAPSLKRKWQLPDLEKLAWAASLVLAIGVGYLANEVYHQRGITGQRPPAELAANTPANAPDPVAAPVAAPRLDREESANRQRAAAPTAGAGAGAADGGASARGSGQLAQRRNTSAIPTAPAAERRDAVRPDPMSQVPKPRRTSKPPPNAARPVAESMALASDNRLRASTDELSSRTADVTTAPTRAAQQAGPESRGRVERNAPPASPGALGDTQAPAAAAPPPLAGAAQANIAVGAREQRDAAAEAPASFRRVPMEEAVRHLSGSIRLIDGLNAARVDVGPGRLVSGADPERDVVRVTYADARGRRLVLDQQLGDTQQGASFNGLMQGDTLVSTTETGATQVRWVDRKFWLSLTGIGPADSVRAIVERVR